MLKLEIQPEGRCWCLSTCTVIKEDSVVQGCVLNRAGTRLVYFQFALFACCHLLYWNVYYTCKHSRAQNGINTVKADQRVAQNNPVWCGIGLKEERTVSLTSVPQSKPDERGSPSVLLTVSMRMLYSWILSLWCWNSLFRFDSSSLENFPEVLAWRRNGQELL